MSLAVIGHRGCPAEAHENTIPSFDLALELGADALELDVRRTRDHELVIIHDPTLDRTTDAAGEVAAHTAAELTQVDAGAGRPGEGDPAPIPRLSEVFERYPGLEITVDVKDPAATAAVVDMIRRFARVPATILYVEEGTELEAFRSFEGRRATSTRQALRARIDSSVLAGGGGPFPEVVHTPLEEAGVSIVTPEFVARVHGAGRTLQAWTVDQPTELRRLADCGVDGVITNDVRTAVRTLKGGQ